MEKLKKTEFTVVLDGIQLPDDVHKKINNEIQDVVMRNVALLDYSKLPWYGQDVPVKVGRGAKPNNFVINRKFLNGYVAKFIDENELHKAIKAGNMSAVSEALDIKNNGLKNIVH